MREIWKTYQMGSEQVHAALILKNPTADVDELVRRANRQLEAYQRIRNWSVWPEITT